VGINVLLHEHRQLLLQVFCFLRKLKTHFFLPITRDHPARNQKSQIRAIRHPEGSSRSGESEGPCVVIIEFPEPVAFKSKFTSHKSEIPGLGDHSLPVSVAPPSATIVWPVM